MQADLAYAELQLEHTEVRSALDGVVSKRSVELGQVVQMGQPLLAIVPLQDVWVVANFKETQLARIRPGMKAAVEVDRLSRQGLHRRDRLDERGHRRPLLAPASGERHRQLGEGRPARSRCASTSTGRRVGNPHTLARGHVGRRHDPRPVTNVFRLDGLRPTRAAP